MPGLGPRAWALWLVLVCVLEQGLAALQLSPLGLLLLNPPRRTLALVRLCDMLMMRMMMIVDACNNTELHCHV